MLDQRVYGIARQEVRTRDPNGSWIELALRALPERRVLVLVRRVGARCVGAAQTRIRGRDALLDHVFVQLGGPARIDHVIVRGVDQLREEPVFERLEP